MSELAKLAGVSVSTVSRSLAGSDLIHKATRDRVNELTRKHHFHPNISARSLRLRRTETIGVVIPLGHQADQHLTDPFFLTMIGNLVDEHQPLRALLHPRLAMRAPHPPRTDHVSAIGFARNSGGPAEFF